MTPAAAYDDAGRYAPDGGYAYGRLALSLLIATLVGAGMWAVIVVLPEAQRSSACASAISGISATVVPLSRSGEGSGVRASAVSSEAEAPSSPALLPDGRRADRGQSSSACARRAWASPGRAVDL